MSQNSPLCAGEAVALQDVVGERVAEHDGADLFHAAYGQLPQVPVAPAGMDAFADRAGLVLRLAGFARHAGAPGQHSGAVAAPRQVGVGAVLGLGGRTIDLDAFAMRPLDVLGAAKAAVDEMALRRPPGRARCRSSIGRMRPRSEPVLQILMATTICSPAALATCTL